MEQVIPPQTRRYSEADYLGMEESSPTKHEFRFGRIIDMAGGSFVHSGIASNLIHGIRLRQGDKSCHVHGSDLRVRITETGHYCYPDVTIICEPPIFDPPDKHNTVVNPQVAIEISSPSSIADDRGDKFYDYMTIESLREYIIVEQDRARVNTFYRQTDGTWVIGPSSDALAGTVTFRSLGITIPLYEIYARVELPKPLPAEGG